MLYNLPTIELRKTPKGKKTLYEAVENGKVVATRLSNREYVAALVGEGPIIANGVGRMDLLPNALKTSYQGIRAIALLNPSV